MIYIFSSESDENKPSIAGSSQSSIDSFLKEIVIREECSDIENSLSSEEKENFNDQLINQTSNKNNNSDSEDTYDDNTSSDESFYSFESESNVLERRVSFGSIKSLSHKNDLNFFNDRKFLTNSLTFFELDIFVISTLKIA